MATWCSKHNKYMLPSKFGGEWCPDCSKEKKGSKTVNETALLMDEIVAFRKEFNERFDAMAKWMTENIKK